jgi:tetrahydromethanopterin S-methyltransferase subunit A
MTPLNAAIAVAGAPKTDKMGIKIGQPTLAAKIANPTLIRQLTCGRSSFIAWPSSDQMDRR